MARERRRLPVAAKIAFLERLIGSIRRECVDHIIVLGEAHLRRILKSYAHYYNETRTHLALHKDAPVSRPVQRTGVVRSRALPTAARPRRAWISATETAGSRWDLPGDISWDTLDTQGES
jgi:Integrase core domain